MNKTLMLVICDFLLLSMLALARFDPPEEAPKPTLDATASSATAEAELISLLEESLESELSSRENLNQDLVDTREDLQEKARLLAEREAALEVTQQNLTQKSDEAAALAESKMAIEVQQQQLTAEKAQIEAEREKLATRFENTRTQLEDANNERVQLASTLGQLKADSSVTKERLNQTEEELIAREIALAEREAALKAAEAEKQRLLEQSTQLNKQLEVAMAERRLLEENLSKEQAEKAQAFARNEQLNANVSELGQGVSKLGQGVDSLNQTSAQIQKEIIDSRPQTMSEIFTRFQNNRADIRFTSSEKNLLGVTVQRNYESKSILITDTQGETYIVTHANDTPFSLSKNPENLLSASISLKIAGKQLNITRIGFLATDPRLIFIPIPSFLIASTGIQTFQLALQPDRWEEAVLIKNDESNFGSTGFRRLTSTERFLKMERPATGELFADFASSRGDLAFTKTGKFIGALTDTKHAVVIQDFVAAAIVDVGSGFNAGENVSTIYRLKDRIRKLPSEVQ